MQVRSLSPLIISLLFIGSSAEAAPSPYEQTAEKLLQTVTTYQELVQQETKYDAVFRRDPMEPLVDDQGNLLTAVGMQEGLMVQGIIWSEEKPFAVIDDTLYAVGDAVGDYTIREIRHDGVSAERNGQTEQIPLSRGFETPPAATEAAQVTEIAPATEAAPATQAKDP